MKKFSFDKIIISPEDIDLSYSPLRGLKMDTYVLGAFNPGMTKLPNGNILLMVRIAEALKNPIEQGKIKAIRWDKNNTYVLDSYNLEQVDISDPRSIRLTQYAPHDVIAITSLSWLLPVELNTDGSEVINIHYDKIISPEKTYQEYGIEDARISSINGKYYMTSCSVSSERHSTTLYSSVDGLNYHLEGIILDHQNKDMLLFEGKINEKYYALTRPLGSLYFATPPDSKFSPGPSINLAQSPDLLHWKPLDEPFIRPLKEDGNTVLKLGGGTQPILTEKGWLVLFHGVEKNDKVGIYRSYWAILDKDKPENIIHLEMKTPLLEANPSLTEKFKDIIYIEDVVFTTGIVEMDDYYMIASGELDLCSRITRIPKSVFNI